MVTAVWFRFRAERRTRWRSWLGLALLVGIGGGITIALAAGARRTDSAYPRLIEAQQSYDITVVEGGFDGESPVPPNFLDRVARLPQVAEAGRFHTLFDNGGRTDEGRAIGEPDYLQTIGGFPPPLVAGLRMALEPGRGATAVPARSILAGAAIGVAVIAGALTFGQGLDHLLEEPGLYGWNWDVTVGDGFGPDAYEDVVPALSRQPSIEAVGAGTFGSVEVEGREVYVLATDAVKGSVGPSVIEGRSPSRPDEMLLGTATLDHLDASIGDVVDVRYVGNFNGEAARDLPAVQLEIVGRGVLPEQSDIGLDDAGAVTYEGLLRLAPGEEPPPNFFPVRFDDTVPLQRPTDLVNFGRVNSLPVLGAGLMALIAVAMLAHLLLSSVRRRRRDLALLKVLGLTRAQVRLTVAWQVTTLVVVALLFGLPLGAATGRWAWTATAQRLGVVAEPVIPVVVLLVLVPLTIVVGNLSAAVPARLAARTRAANLLRAD